MTEYLFSEFKNKEFDLLHQEISEILDIPKVEYRNIYETMRQEFEFEGCPSEVSLSRNIFRSRDLEFQKRYSHAFVVGVDIPSLLERNDGFSNKKTVVILGQDPLRKSKERIEEIGIATPYGMHLKICREKDRNTRLYFDLIRVLLDEGYRVYLTDIFKVWVSEVDKDKAISLSRKDYQRFTDVLRVELGIFNPLVVISWGQIAAKAFKSINSNFKHLECPHPSAANHHTWCRLMASPSTRENRLVFWKQKINNALLNS